MCTRVQVLARNEENEAYARVYSRILAYTRVARVYSVDRSSVTIISASNYHAALLSRGRYFSFRSLTWWHPPPFYYASPLSYTLVDSILIRVFDENIDHRFLEQRIVRTSKRRRFRVPGKSFPSRGIERSPRHWPSTLTNTRMRIARCTRRE